jgi:hypothetical protein
VPTHKLYVIQNGTLQSMAANERFTREFPFLTSLRSLAPAKPGCGTCGGGGSPKAAADAAYAAALRTIAGLASDKKQRLKALLDAKQVRLFYRAADGRQIKLTF